MCSFQSKNLVYQAGLRPTGILLQPEKTVATISRYLSKRGFSVSMDFNDLCYVTDVLYRRLHKLREHGLLGSQNDLSRRWSQKRWSKLVRMYIALLPRFIFITSVIVSFKSLAFMTSNCRYAKTNHSSASIRRISKNVVKDLKFLFLRTEQAFSTITKSLDCLK